MCQVTARIETSDEDMQLPAPTETENKAATTISACMKGHVARKHTQILKASKFQVFSCTMCQSFLCVTLQCIVEGHGYT